MTFELNITLVEDADRLRACWPVMAQLRPHLTEAAFVEQVQRQRLAGYRLAAGMRGDRVLVVAGFVLGEKLAWGRHLYVDDLVTDDAARSTGAGGAMLDWLKAHARDAGCAALHLDSGLQRQDAHRFYAREGMRHASAHFSIPLDARSDEAAPSTTQPSTTQLSATEPSATEPPEAPARRIRRGSGPLGENTLYPHLSEGADGGDHDFDPSHEGGLDHDFD